MTDPAGDIRRRGRESKEGKASGPVGSGRFLWHYEERKNEQPRMPTKYGYFLLKLQFMPEVVAEMRLDLIKGGEFLTTLEHLPTTMPVIKDRGAWAANVDMAAQYGWVYLLFAETDAVPILQNAVQGLKEVASVTIQPATEPEVSDYQRRLAGQRDLAQKWIESPSLSTISGLRQPLKQIIPAGFIPWNEWR
jgi:hypothetical protein